MLNLQDYTTLKEEARKFYDDIGRVYCPALQKSVRFNAAGFNHIIFKKERAERDKHLQAQRFKLLPSALKLVAVATTYQEFETTKHGVLYWGIIGIIENRKLKVVLKKPSTSNEIDFWSVIPDPITSKRRDLNFFEMMGD